MVFLLAGGRGFLSPSLYKDGESNSMPDSVCFLPYSLSAGSGFPYFSDFGNFL